LCVYKKTHIARKINQKNINNLKTKQQ